LFRGVDVRSESMAGQFGFFDIDVHQPFGKFAVVPMPPVARAPGGREQGRICARSASVTPRE
jgi:hypothetical protein